MGKARDKFSAAQCKLAEVSRENEELRKQLVALHNSVSRYRDESRKYHRRAEIALQWVYFFTFFSRGCERGWEGKLNEFVKYLDLPCNNDLDLWKQIGTLKDE